MMPYYGLTNAFSVNKALVFWHTQSPISPLAFSRDYWESEDLTVSLMKIVVVEPKKYIISWLSIIT